LELGPLLNSVDFERDGSTGNSNLKIAKCRLANEKENEKQTFSIADWHSAIFRLLFLGALQNKEG